MEKMLNLVLFGPPGAGKGTQSENLIDKYGLVHLSTGDILRTEIARGTDLGTKAKSVMDRGELVSDDVVIAMIEGKLDANPNAKGFIFDGFPRTANQAEALDDLLQKKGTGISAMIALEVEDEELVKRLLKRGIGSGRPDDSNEDVIRRRIVEYNNKTLLLKNYYNEQGKFHSIHGVGSIDEIFTALINRIVFLKAEMELTELETDLEHLDLTVQDYEEANDIAPELLLEIDAVKRAEAEEEDDAKTAKKLNSSKKSNVSIISNAEHSRSINKAKTKKVAPKKVTKSVPAKKALVKKSAPKKAVSKTSAKKKTVKSASPKKVVKKMATKKVVVKKVVKKLAKKILKKVVSKPTPKKKVVAKKIVKKSVKKVFKKAVKKAIPKKVAKKIAPKKLAKKLSSKKTLKKKK